MTESLMTAALREDFAALVVSVVLCTVAVGLVAFALLRRSTRYRELLYAGAFAALYGVRLAADSAWAEFLIGEQWWLNYVLSFLNYLVPIAGSMVFLHTFGERWTVLNRSIVTLFILCAVVAIPYEIATAQPFAGGVVVDSLVMIFIVTLLLNLFVPGKSDADDRRIIRWGATVFCLFVLNEHLHFVRAPWNLAAEPLGFLFFIGAMVFVTMRRVVNDQVHLVAMKSELGTARRIQMSIIPRHVPASPGLDIGTLYQPASDVGGDFYDFLDGQDGKFGLLVADVSGHGVPAALLASMLKIALANQLAHCSEPATVLTNLNRQFFGKLDRQFITAAYAYIDTRSWQAILATAGHPSVLLRKGKAEGVSEVRTEGPILGRFRSVAFTEATLSLGVGDTLIFYTDGVTETRNRAEEPWGEERLHHTLLRTTGQSAAATAADIARAAADWTGSERFEDDVTLVVLTRFSEDAAPPP